MAKPELGPQEKGIGYSTTSCLSFQKSTIFGSLLTIFGSLLTQPVANLESLEMTSILLETSYVQIQLFYQGPFAKFALELVDV